MRQMGLDSVEVEEDGILKVVYQGRQIRLAAFGVHWKGRSLVLGAPRGLVVLRLCFCPLPFPAFSP